MGQSSFLCQEFHSSCWVNSFLVDGGVYPQKLFISLDKISVLFCSYMKHRHCTHSHPAQQRRRIVREEDTRTGSALTMHNSHPSVVPNPDLQRQAMRSEINKGHTGRSHKIFYKQMVIFVFPRCVTTKYSHFVSISCWWITCAVLVLHNIVLLSCCMLITADTYVLNYMHLHTHKHRKYTTKFSIMIPAAKKSLIQVAALNIKVIGLAQTKWYLFFHVLIFNYLCKVDMQQQCPHLKRTSEAT